MNTQLKMQSKVTGNGRPLVLVPGGLTGWKSWEPFVEYFTNRSRTVILVQLLNVEFGLENRPMPDVYSVKMESHALAETLESLDSSEPFDIVAWSFGALITLEYALDHPDRVRSLVLIEPPAIWILRALGRIDPETQSTIDFFKTLHGDITEEMLASFLKEAGFVRPGQSPRDLPQWEHWLPYRRSLRNSPAIISQVEDHSKLGGFTRPVLLVKGTGSAHFLHKILDELKAGLPKARIIEFPGGHAPHLVSKDQFLAELENFQSAMS